MPAVIPAVSDVTFNVITTLTVPYDKFFPDSVLLSQSTRSTVVMMPRMMQFVLNFVHLMQHPMGIKEKGKCQSSVEIIPVKCASCADVLLPAWR